MRKDEEWKLKEPYVLANKKYEEWDGMESMKNRKENGEWWF